MTPSLRNKLLVLAKLVSVLIVAFLGVYLRNPVALFVLCVFVILWPWLANKYKKQVSLTPEERQKPLEKELVFNNAVEWFPLIAWTLVFVLTVSIFLASHKFITNWSDGVFWMVIYLLNVAFFLAPSRNRYSISDDTLIVQEYDFFRWTTDLRIPLNTIENVCIADLFTLTPRVIITVNGIERKLRCTTHTLSLAKALALRIT